MTAFWELWAMPIAKRLGSWGVEILGGFLLATVVQLAIDGLVAQALTCLCASLAYELFLDPNGLEWSDVLQRSVGIALGLGVWIWIR